MRACPATLLIVAALCGGLLPTQAMAKSSATAMAPSFEELMNLKYSGLASGAVTLADGRHRDAGGSVDVGLAPWFRVSGDLDGDGQDEAVVMLFESPGGSGTFGCFAVVGRRQGVPVNLSTVQLGDRVQVRDARIEGKRLVADVVRHGPSDPMCCPGELATLAWELRGGKLHSARTGVPPQRLSPAIITGPEWVLRSRVFETNPVPDAIEITLTMSADRIAGSAGCNRYSATVTSGDSRGNMGIRVVGVARTVCPEPQMAAEGRFIARLAGVRRYFFSAGLLGLEWESQELGNDRGGVLYFERRLRKPKP